MHVRALMMGVGSMKRYRYEGSERRLRGDACFANKANPPQRTAPLRPSPPSPPPPSPLEQRENTTKFSKWIKKKKQHLKDKILQCAAHLTGIAWQRRSHTKFFDDQTTYKKFYKLLVRCLRCSNTALATILQRKIVEWLRTCNEPRARRFTALTGSFETK